MTTSIEPGWEARFRAPRTRWARVARGAPDRGLVASDATGTYQLHRWKVRTGATARHRPDVRPRALPTGC